MLSDLGADGNGTLRMIGADTVLGHVRFTCRYAAPMTERPVSRQARRRQMREAAAELDFETAAKLRDELFALTGEAPIKDAKPLPGTPGSARQSRGRSRKSPHRNKSRK